MSQELFELPSIITNCCSNWECHLLLLGVTVLLCSFNETFYQSNRNYISLPGVEILGEMKAGSMEKGRNVLFYEFFLSINNLFTPVLIKKKVVMYLVSCTLQCALPDILLVTV
jgi:hypothetical protein